MLYHFKQWQTLFSLAPKSLQLVTAAVKLRHLLLGRKAMTNLDSILKSRNITFSTKVCLVKAMVFPGSHVRMCELDHKEGWAPNNGYFWIVVLEKTLRSLLDCKEMKPVNSKGNQPWIFIGRTDAEPEAPILLPPDAKSQLSWKDPDAGKEWRQKEKVMTEGEIVGWLANSIDMIEEVPGVSDG